MDVLWASRFHVGCMFVFRSEIRCELQACFLEMVETIGILDCNEPRAFWLAWYRHSDDSSKYLLQKESKAKMTSHSISSSPKLVKVL